MSSANLNPIALAYLMLGAEQVSETADGFSYVPEDLDVSGFPAALVAVTAEVLADTKRAKKAEIDAAAELARLKFITPGSGQAMTYQAKSDEARRFSSDTAPNASEYPLLSAELGITGPTLADVASAVLAALAQWQQIGGAIETVRLTAKASIENATSIADVQSVTAVFP